MSKINVYKVEVRKVQTFETYVLAMNEDEGKKQVEVLIKHGLFPAYAGAEVGEVTVSSVLPHEHLHAIHRTLEAIAFDPANTNKELLKALYGVAKPIHTLESLAATNLWIENGQANVVVADKSIAKVVAANVPHSPIKWTYATSKGEPLRFYLSIEAYMLALQQTIAAHDILYDRGASVITDSDYDKLYQHLVELEERYPYMVHVNSPTQRIIVHNTLVDTLEKVRHSRPMLSLGKGTTADAVLKFLAQAPGEPILLQRKEDGLTVVGTFEEGVPLDYVSRGDSEVGERLLHSCSQIVNIPKQIAFKGRLELRFEVIVPYAEFERINTDGKYSNTRNLASGTVRSLDGNLTKERGLKAYVIEIVDIEGQSFEYDHERIEFVRNLGFEISDTYAFFEKGKDVQQETQRLLSFIEAYDTAIRPTLPHMIDGLVLKFDRIALREELGETSKVPRWAIAYKFSSQDATSTLRDCIFQVGKSGQISPVAEFDMVEIDGVEVRRSTLHNFSNIEDKDIRIGDKILIARANDVIPQVVKSFHELRDGSEMKIELPPVCPACSGTIKREGEHAFCINPKCEPQIIGKLEHYVSRNAMNIDGCGEKTIAMMYEEGFVKTLADIYRLRRFKQQIIALENFGEKKYAKMIEGIETSKEQPLNNFIYSLSIYLIGQRASKAISKVYDNMNEILEDAKTPAKLKAKLLAIDDFGEKMVSSFVQFITAEENIALIHELMAEGLTMLSPAKANVVASPISGKTFVITGKLSMSRDAFKDKIEQLGGKVTGSVGKKTDYLLMGPDANGTTKHKTALSLDVTILYEDDFNLLLKEVA
jgi:DNA ligase (NAD+)